MTDIVHFEITSDDVEATARFYAQVFGWTPEASPFIADYTLLRGGPVTGAVMSNTYQKQKIIIWHKVTDIDAVLDAMVAAGGTRIGEINTIPGEGKLAYAADPNGTVLGLKQPA